MSDEKALTVYTPHSLDEIKDVGAILAQSGFFSDSRQAAQAIVKILAGIEMGIGPVEAMTGLFIVNGRVTESASIMAAQIKRDPRYDYRILEHTDAKCRIEFFECGISAGISEFTIQDAQRAELTVGKNAHSWKHYPRNMLFARAISNGRKWFCPDASGVSGVYTPEELDLQINGDTGEIVDADFVLSKDAEPQPEPPTESTESTPNMKAPRPWGGGTVRHALQKKAASLPHSEASAGKRGLMTGKLNELCGGDAARYEFLEYVFGVTSSKELGGAQVEAILAWMLDNDGFSEHASAEAANLLRAAALERGQQDMFDDDTSSVSATLAAALQQEAWLQDIGKSAAEALEEFRSSVHSGDWAKLRAMDSAGDVAGALDVLADYFA